LLGRLVLVTGGS